MLLNMGNSSKRKAKDENCTSLQDDALLGELLGEIKTTSSTKSGSTAASKTVSSNAKGVARPHSNPFAVVRPASTGIKRKVSMERPPPKIKAEEESELDEGILSQMIDDDDFSQPNNDVKMEVDADDAETPTQKIEDDDVVEETAQQIASAQMEDEDDKSSMENASVNRGFKASIAVKKEPEVSSASDLGSAQPQGWKLNKSQEVK